MNFNFKIDDSLGLKSFVDLQNEMNRVFWKKRGQHNYKQIVYYRIGSYYYPIRNDNDVKELIEKENYKDIELKIAFIARKHSSNINKAIEHTAPYHMDISCDGCGIQPTIGTLYRCLECPNSVHLCEVCETDKQHSQHMMFSVKKSNINPNLHATIHCDSCKVEPIIGFRYKCISCHLSYCEYCTNYEVLPCDDHEMIRCPDRSGETATGTVDTQVDVQIVEDRQLKIINNKLDKVLEVITSDGLNIAGATVLGRGTASEISHNQEEKSDESKEVDRTVYKAD